MANYQGRIYGSRGLEATKAWRPLGPNYQAFLDDYFGHNYKDRHCHSYSVNNVSFYLGVYHGFIKPRNPVFFFIGSAGLLVIVGP